MKQIWILAAAFTMFTSGADARAACGKAEALKIAKGLEKTFTVVKRRESKGKISMYFDDPLVPAVSKFHLDKVTNCTLRVSSSNPTRMQILYR
jgi:hypothetical protein